MARGENEKICFDYIKRELFFEKAFNCSFDTYCKNRIMLSKRPSEIFFAMTKQDIEKVENIFFKAKANADLNQFPDFVSDEGVVEHFQITSSETSKVGAEYKKAFSVHKKEFEKEVKQLKSEMEENPSFGEIKSVESGFFYRGGHSHENLIFSLKQSVNKHIISEEKYEGVKSTKIFMLEYDELSLKMKIDYPDVKQERLYGDLLRREKVSDYRLSRDKEALNYLYDKRDYIDYVVFVTEHLFEIIKVEDIPEILKLIVFDYEFHSSTLITLSCMYGTSIPVPLSENDDGEE